MNTTLGSVRYCAKELEISLAKIDKDSATEKQRWQMSVLYTDAVELETITVKSNQSSKKSVDLTRRKEFYLIWVCFQFILKSWTA